MSLILQERYARSVVQRYGVAVLLVLLAAPLSAGLTEWFTVPPLVPFYGAVALAVWYGGLVPGLAATALSVVVYGLFVLEPRGQWVLVEDDASRITAFVLLGLLLSFLGLGRDRAEGALRASERRFRTMLETANEGVWLLDRNGRTQYANDRMAALLGAVPERVQSGSVGDFVFAEDVEAVRERIAANLAGRAEEFDFRFRRVDGQEVLVLAGTSPVRDGLGRVVGSLGLFTDITARRRAEAGLSRANERFALAADAVQSLIYEWDVRSGKVERSAGLFPLLGFRPDEVPPEQAWWVDRIHPDDRDVIQMQRQWDRPGGDRYSYEYRVCHRDGRWITVWDQGRIMRDEKGAAIRIIGNSIDITARTEAEQALRLLDESGRTLASSLDYEETLQRVASFTVPTLADWCMVDLLDDQGIIRRVAVAPPGLGHADLASSLLNVPPSASIDEAVARVIETGDALLISQTSDDAGALSDEQQTQPTLLPEEGLFSAMVLPMRAGGNVHGVMTLATTAASNRRYDEEDLALAKQLARRSAVAIQNARLYRDAQAAEDRYRGLFEGTKDGIMVFDPSGLSIDANAALLEMAGYSREELVGNPAVLIAQGGPWSGEEAERLRRDGQWRGGFDLRRKDGFVTPVESWITRVMLPTGPAYVGVLRDVSERKRFEAVQEEFLSSLAHDLKNPLTTVIGQTQILLRRISRGEPTDLPRLSGSLEGMKIAAFRMTALLDELSDVMRLRAGQEIELHREPTDLVELARRSVDEQARTSELHPIRLRTEVASLPGIWDAPRLERVLGNLLGNAIKFSPAGGDITISIARESANGVEDAVLSVQDRGVGIPQNDRDLIFERFRRAGNVESFAGSGIGLAGAKRIVELHGGAITVTSAEGEGSTFTIRLPITPAGD